MANTTAMGTLLLLGAVFLSLNALAVSARPGDVSAAEQTIAVPPVAAPGTVVHSGNPIVVPPSQNPIAVGSGIHVIRGPGVGSNVEPAAVSVPRVAPLTASVEPAQNVSVGAGLHAPIAGATPPVQPVPGVGPGVAPVPVPPITPGPGKIPPVPTPPYSVDPVRKSL